MKTVYAIPGLATTGELFQLIKLDNAKIVTLEWPRLNDGETMASYAEKFAAKIDTSKPFYLLGVSFGGMLCAEISLLLKPQKTFLISSCKCVNEIPDTIRVFETIPLHHILSEAVLKELTLNSRLLLGFEKKFMPEFERMVNSMQPNYFRRSIDCIVNWKAENCLRDDIIHIHGDDDRLLFYNDVKADYTIKGGTHAMIVNNAVEISNLLNRLIE